MTWKYLPDVPRDTPNVWRGCDGFHADRSGVMRTGFMATSYSDYGSSAGVCGKAYRTAAGALGIVVMCPFVAGGPAAGHGYVWNGSTWNDRFNSTSNRVCGSEGIAQFGNITYAACANQGIYSRDATGTSNFASVAGSPTCSILLLTPQNIMVALDAIQAVSSGGSYGAGADAWYASDVGDPTNWATGEYATNNLRQTPGPITAGVVFGNDVIVFKRKGIYRGTYIGGQYKWAWGLIPGGEALGAWGPGSAIAAAGRVYFYGDDGLYSFDGASFRKLDLGIWSTILQTIGDPSGAFDDDNYVALQLAYDSINRRIALFNFGAITASLGARVSNQPQFFTYHIDSEAFGYQSQVKDVASGDLYSGVVANAEEINAFSNGVWTYNSNLALISSSNTDIRIISDEFTSANCGTTYKPSLTTSYYGNRQNLTLVTRFIPNWTLSDGAGTNLSGATVKTFTPGIADAPTLAGALSLPAVTLSTNRYWADYTGSAWFHSGTLQINCEACIDGAQWIGQPAGSN